MGDLAVSFWELVNQLIKTNKATQEDLAKSLNIPFGTYRGWNAYKRLPDASSAYHIAKALGTTVEYLVTGEDIGGIPQEIISIAQKIAGLDREDKEEIMLLVDHKIVKNKHEKKLEQIRASTYDAEVETLNTEDITREPEPTYAKKEAEKGEASPIHVKDRA